MQINFLLLPLSVCLLYGENLIDGQSKLAMIDQGQKSLIDTAWTKQDEQRYQEELAARSNRIQQARIQIESELIAINVSNQEMLAQIKALKKEKKRLNIEYKIARNIRLQKEAAEQKRLREIRAKKERLRKLCHVKVKISIASQKMDVYRGDKLIHKWKVSTAKKGYMTPTGNFEPQVLKEMHYSSLYENSPMPYTVFFNGNYAIHGTNAIGRLGSRASHGCVRLHPDNAKTLYGMIEKSGKSNAEIKITP